MTGSLALPARAKLNLSLRVVGRRSDGYHLLETLFHAIALHDDLALTLVPSGIELVISAASPELTVMPGPDNLVHRALHRFATAVGYDGGFVARLHKRIPHGGGLGGGSSDAAAALRLANELLQRPLAASELADLALGLGADVPFFLRGGSQWGRGVGEQLTAAVVAPMLFTLVLPAFGCPTADVYKSFAAQWKGSRGGDTLTTITVPDTGDSAVRIAFHNDLLAAAERVQPALAELRRQIAQLGYPEVAMTGSGSTLFLAHADSEAQQRCCRVLKPLLRQGIRLMESASADAGIDEPRPPDRLGASV